MNAMLKKAAIILLASALTFLLAFPFLPAVASGEGDIALAAGEHADESGMKSEAKEGAPGLEATSAETYFTQGTAAEAGEDEKAPAADFTAAALSIEGAPDPWEVTSLKISKDVDLVEAVDPEIGLEKTASEDYLEMTVGEKKEVTFTIKVTASLSPDTYYIAGNIFVQNTGEWPADVTAVSDTVWYKASGPSWLAAPSSITTTVPLGDNSIPTGGPHVYSYAGTFTLPVALSSVAAMSNLIEITISNKPDPPKPGMKSWTFQEREDFDKPAVGGPQVVSLEDVESMDPSTGLGYEIKSVTVNGSPAGSLAGPWLLDLDYAPYTLLITKELTAEAAGIYTLNNKARIGELEDEVEVEIEIKEREEIVGSITGQKYVDLDADGKLDTGEPGLEGVLIRLYRVNGPDGDVQAAAVLLAASLVGQTYTDGDGYFSFTDLDPGKYLVSEEVPKGYYPTSANPVEVAVDSEEPVEVLFLNAPFASVAGAKWLDTNGNGRADEGESGLDEVTIQLLDADGLLVAETKTAGGGGYSFVALKPGRYIVQERVPFGYEATTPTAVTFDLLPGEKKKVDFFNRVPVAGEVVTPPVEPQVQVGAEQTLPATGFDVLYLLVAMGMFLAAGALLASLGAARMIRAR